MAGIQIGKGEMMSQQNLSEKSPLVGLKDFQKRSVEHVFKHLYGDGAISNRFLVADEVGLGKTIVAKGVIAKVLEHLKDSPGRIDVLYICSNAAIAKQNIARLNVTESQCSTLATRLTLLPRTIKDLCCNKVNFISMTPGTAFDHSASRSGTMEERLIIYQILSTFPWEENGAGRNVNNGLMNLLQVRVSRKKWKGEIKKLDEDVLNEDLCDSFRKAVRRDKELFRELENECINFVTYCKNSNVSLERRIFRDHLIGKLREKLAKTCLTVLKPKLIILDEFQRFKDLLDLELAKSLYENKDAKILLLSATPYKPFTMKFEKEQDDHYPDLIKTLEFLFKAEAKVEEVKALLAKQRSALHDFATGGCFDHKPKLKLEKLLGQVMCRTERIESTLDLNSMLKEIVTKPVVTSKDIAQADMAHKVAKLVKATGPVEYWKSVPYILNFLKGYDLRVRLESEECASSEDIIRIIRAGRQQKQLLKKIMFENYCDIDPGNPRLRDLFAETIDQGLWQLLWMPPSMPYMEPTGVYSGKGHLTKSLVFSSWSAVPTAVASLCSYAAERLMVDDETVKRSKLSNHFGPLLRFSEDIKTKNEKRLSGMPVLALIMPYPALAAVADPLAIATEYGRPVTATELKDKVKAAIISSQILERLPAPDPAKGPDERWYWAAPMLLESGKGLVNWCGADEGLVKKVQGDSEDGSGIFAKHVDLLVQVANGKISLGARPADLVDLLSEMVIAAPGVCALRALHRLTPGLDMSDTSLLSGAAQIAFGYRKLFNIPESIAMLRKNNDGVYWRLVLNYAFDGNIQAVLDEYVHVLKESLGLQGHPYDKQIEGIAEHIKSVLSLDATRVGIDELKFTDGVCVVENFNMRCRFALRLGEGQSESSDGKNIRVDAVKNAFNSPFRPFVLASTSIGQEGLDFHTWCHAVTHWNLPANPVDLEQREGRVQRYKGHAVRKNIAECYGLPSLKSESLNGADPWQVLFDLASKNKAPGLSDLVPYWIFEQGSAKIERRVPMLPLSREVEKLKNLKLGLSKYRLAFGQTRQEEFLHLFKDSDMSDVDAIAKLMISLKPK